jgi:hypothetical protein
MVDELGSLAGTKDSDLNSIFRQGYRRVKNLTEVVNPSKSRLAGATKSNIATVKGKIIDFLW